SATAKRARTGLRAPSGASSSLLAHSLLQALPRQLQALVERVPGSPIELARGQRRVDDAAHDLARAGLRVDGLAFDPGHAPADRGQLVHRHFDAGADVVHAAYMLGRGQDPVHDVADVDEVARLLAAAEDRRLLACREPLEEDRDHAALEARLLPRPVDVRE